MKILGNDIKRILNLDITDNDYEIEYDGELPVKYILKDGMELTLTYDDNGVLQTISNGYATMTLQYNVYGQLIKTVVEEN